METIKNAIQQMPPRNRTTAFLAALAAGAAIFAFVRWEKEQRFQPLYSSLSPEDAASIIEKLKESGVDYRVSGNGAAIEIASDKTAELRLQLAAAGLPKSGRIGFELFDKTSFGATDFTEQVNYRRALEGELERSIMSLHEVEQARVHLTFARDSVFLDARQPAKASVLVRLRAGAALAPGSVLAVTHLVASAVEGLSPGSVSVLDMRGNLLNRPRPTLAAEGAEPDALLDHQQQIERSLLAKINSTLEPLLGAEKFRAALSVDCDFTSGEQSEEIFDPSRSVMVNSQKTEDASVAGGAGGLPGTASSLPRADSSAARPASGLSRRMESISYQSSRTVRRTRLPQGTIRRISASVLVDHELQWEGHGAGAKRNLQAPSPEQLKVIRDVVAGAIALNPDRGDQLIVESIPFGSTLHAAPPAPPGPKAQPPKTITRVVETVQENPAMGFGVAGGLVLVLALLLGWLFARLRSGKQPRPAAQVVPAQKQVPAASPRSPSLPAPVNEEHRAQAAVAPQVGKRIEAAATMLRSGTGSDAQAYAGALAQWVHGEGA